MTYPVEAAGNVPPHELFRRFQVRGRIQDSGIPGSLGLLGLELEGDEQELQRALGWLRRQGVRVDPIELSIVTG
ncbi:MAG: NIL domain-containing protein [Verrucomicrobiota bacterium]